MSKLEQSIDEMFEKPCRLGWTAGCSGSKMDGDVRPYQSFVILLE
jgi:hypothetical protein